METKRLKRIAKVTEEQYQEVMNNGSIVIDGVVKHKDDYEFVTPDDTLEKSKEYTDEKIETAVTEMQGNLDGVEQEINEYLMVLNGITLPKYTLNEDGATCTLSGNGFFPDGIPLKVPMSKEFFVLEDGVIVKKDCNVTDIAVGVRMKVSKLTLPYYIKNIGVRVFVDSTIKELILPPFVESIGERAFAGCANLETVEFSTDIFSQTCRLASIGAGAFLNCSSLKTVVIGDSQVSYTIGNAAFSSNTALESITLGKGLTSIGPDAFYGCSSLTNVKFNGTVEEWNAIGGKVYLTSFVPATKVVCSDGEVAL